MNEHINATIDFVEKYGYEKIKTNTSHVYNGIKYDIGVKKANNRMDSCNKKI